MAIQTGVGAAIAYKDESAWGTKPAATGPFAKLVRRVGWTLGLNKGTVQSAEVRSDRAISDYRHTIRGVSGDYTGELSVTGQKDFLEYLAGNDFATGINSGAIATVAAASGANTFTRSAGSWITAGFKVGDIVRWTGWTTTGAGNNSKNFRIVALTATVMTVAESVASKAEGDSVTATVVGEKVLMPGTTKKSFSVEHKFTDITQYQSFTGIRVGRLALRFPPEGIVGFTFSMIGKDAEALTGTEYFTTPDAPDASPLLAFAQGKIRVGGVDVGTVTSLDLTIDNALSTLPVGGTPYTPDVFWGRQTVSGNMTALFEGVTFPNAFTDETEIAVHVFLEAAGVAPAAFANIVLPRVKLGSDARPINTEQGILGTYSFMGLLPTTTQTALGYDANQLVWQTSS